MSEKVRPLDVLYDLMLAGWASAAPRRPGVIVGAVKGERREALQRLTSDEVRTLRPFGAVAQRRSK